jgi:hypothetical protein
LRVSLQLPMVQEALCCLAVKQPLFAHVTPTSDMLSARPYSLHTQSKDNRHYAAYPRTMCALKCGWWHFACEFAAAYGS